MKFQIIEDLPRKFSFKLSNLKTSEGAIYGNSLRRATTIYSQAFALCAVNVVVDGITYKAYNIPIDGVEEQLASIVLSMRDARIKVDMSKQYPIGAVERLVYDGNSKVVTLDMLRSESGNLSLNLDNLTKPKVIINNIGGCHIHLEVVYIFNSGDSLKDYNKLYLSEGGLDSQNYLITASKHSDVLNTSFVVNPTGNGEEMIFTIETINISAKEVVLKTLQDLDKKLMSIAQSLESL